ncbi:MAG: hypothetical protein WCI21_08045 [Alphaproteobacteria bacterium]
MKRSRLLQGAAGLGLALLAAGASLAQQTAPKAAAPAPGRGG